MTGRSEVTGWLRGVARAIRTTSKLAMVCYSEITILIGVNDD
jgi:hypothetical protein